MHNRTKDNLLLFLFSGILIFLSSCTSEAAVRENLPYAYLTNSSKYFLLPPGDIEKPMDMAQQISASYNNRDFLFNAWIKADETELDMTLLNELGANLGELNYRDGALTFSSTVFPRSLHPEYIVADFQLCFYNTLKLRNALENCGLTFEASEQSRRICQGDTVIIDIKKSRNAVSLTNYLRGYNYTLEGDFE